MGHLSGPMLTAIPLQSRRGMEPGYRLWVVWSRTARVLQAPSALMHLLILTYASGCNLEIALPESIQDLASNIGTSFS